MAFRLSALGSHNYRSGASMFKKREATWRPLKLITRLAFLPGVLVLFLAFITLFSLLFSYSDYNISRSPPSNSNIVDIESSEILPPGHVSLISHHPQDALKPPKIDNNNAPSKSDANAQSKMSLKTKQLPPAAEGADASQTAAGESKTPTAADVAAHTVAAGKPKPAQKESPPKATCKWGKYAKWPYVEEYPQLSPYRSKLLYIKTPKSSSSTIAHLLQRYTTREGLVIGYPDHSRDEWTLDSVASFEAALKRANVGPRKHVDASVSHIVYRKPRVDKLLGTERPFRVTSIREPVARSWSMFLHGLSFNLSDFSFGAKTPWEFAKKMDVDGQAKYITGWNEGIVNWEAEGRAGDPADIFKHYDHVILSGRVMESLVTLAPKLGLKVSDLLFFSQKASGFHKKPTDIVTAAEKRNVDKLLRSRTQGDRRVYEMAKRRLDSELKELPDKIKGVLGDVKAMKKDVAKVCGKIDGEDNSCMKKGEIVWDGNAVCQARCIEQWARRNIECEK